MSLIDPLQFVTDDHRRRLWAAEQGSASAQVRTRRAPRRLHLLHRARA